MNLELGLLRGAHFTDPSSLDVLHEGFEIFNVASVLPKVYRLSSSRSLFGQRCVISVLIHFVCGCAGEMCTMWEVHNVRWRRIVDIQDWEIMVVAPLRPLHRVQYSLNVQVIRGALHVLQRRLLVTATCNSF